MRRLARVHALVAVALFAALTAVVALQVVNRLVLHLPITWSEEIARFLFFWVVLLGAALSVRRRRHFVLDVSMGRFHPTGRLAHVLFDVLPDLAVVGFLAFLLVVGLEYAWTGAFRTAPNSRVSMAVVYAAIPVFALLSLAYATAGLVKRLRRPDQAGAVAAPGPGGE